MAASNRETIMKAMKTLLEGVTVANGHPITVNEVKRGIHGPDDIPNRPAVGFTGTDSSRIEFAQGGRSWRDLTIMVYGYVDCDAAAGVYDNLDDLIQGIEQRLMTPASWAYQEWTNIMGMTTIEAGAHDMVSYFDMEVVVSYQYEWADP